MHTASMTPDRTYFRAAASSQTLPWNGTRVSSHEVSPQSVAAAEALITELAGVYERGWQPADLVHLARRSKDPSNADLVATAVLLDAARTRAADRAPLEWVGQLASIREQFPNADRIAARVRELLTDLVEDRNLR